MIGAMIAILGFILFAAGSAVYIFVDFFLQPIKRIYEFADRKYLDTISVRAMYAGFVIMWFGIALHCVGINHF
ncbi:hypothetical protein KGQ34_01365 [Patescibacteria group bacterium]|nr:hypothetical protein [Patescibacteria group bacterium]